MKFCGTQRTRLRAVVKRIDELGQDSYVSRHGWRVADQSRR